ncbi:uncharacterized protein [Rutidosis leptorrhynchoides]|uniref:uncharacterized protein n=1 Tax=Rutidosis leptorrhynchoides TaxID=125765 RepID=UPI003A99AE33
MSSSSSSSGDSFTNYTLNVLEDLSSKDEVNSHRYIRRNRYEAHERLMDDYFDEGCKYTNENFKRRFRMRRRVFLSIMNDILSYSSNPLPYYFRWLHRTQDSRGRWSISPHLKMTAALRQLAYGYTLDALDKYLQMSERVGRESLHNFCKCIIDFYANVYLREPTLHDIHHLYEGHERIHGFPGILGSIDCMHWAWEKCLVAWRGQYIRGDHSHPTIIEDNRYNLAENDWVVEPVQHIQRTWIDRCDARARRTRELRDREVHEGLRSDLVEHLWDFETTYEFYEMNYYVI